MRHLQMRFVNMQYALFFTYLYFAIKYSYKYDNNQRRHVIPSLISGPLHTLSPVLGYLKKLYAIC
jgi:hypothetical protein